MDPQPMIDAIPDTTRGEAMLEIVGEGEED